MVIIVIIIILVIVIIGYFRYIRIALDSEAWRTRTKEIIKHSHSIHYFVSSKPHYHEENNSVHGDVC